MTNLEIAKAPWLKEKLDPQSVMLERQIIEAMLPWLKDMRISDMAIMLTGHDPFGLKLTPLMCGKKLAELELFQECTMRFGRSPGIARGTQQSYSALFESSDGVSVNIGSVTENSAIAWSWGNPSRYDWGDGRHNILNALIKGLSVLG